MKELTSQNDKLVSDLKVSSKEVETLKVFLASAKKKHDEENERLSQEVNELKRVKNRETVDGQISCLNQIRALRDNVFVVVFTVRRMDKDKAVVKENTAHLQRNVEKAVKKLHEDFSNIFSKSGLYFDVDASSDESGSDDQAMDAQGSAEVLAETAQPTEELSAPEREGA